MLLLQTGFVASTGYERLGSATSSRVSGGCRRKRKLSLRDRHHLAAPLRLDAGVSVDVGIAEGVQVGGEMARVAACPLRAQYDLLAGARTLPFPARSHQR